MNRVFGNVLGRNFLLATIAKKHNAALSFAKSHDGHDQGQRRPGRRRDSSTAGCRRHWRHADLLNRNFVGVADFGASLRTL